MTQNTSLAKTYSSGRNNHVGRGSKSVTVNGEPLHDVERVGFTWGFNGRRDINLAHSIMVDYFEDPNVPRGLWITFYEEVMANYKPNDEWDITGQMISQWIYSRFNIEQEDEHDSEPVTEERRKPLDESDTEKQISTGTLWILAVPTIVNEDEEEFDDDDDDDIEIDDDELE